MKKNLVIIFDFDGTIVDSINSVNKIMNQLSGELGFKKMAKNEFEKLKEEKTGRAFEKMDIPFKRISFILKKVKVVLAKEIKNIKPVKGMKKVLLRLKRKGYKLGILTSSLSKNVKIFLDKNRLNIFNFSYSGSNLFEKDKRMRKILNKEKLNPENVFYVGDETRDIEAAKKAGIKSIAVTWGFNKEKILRKQKPDYLIKKPEELIKLLDKF